MTPVRLFAVFVIFGLACVAWVVLGTANVVRSEDRSATLTGEVGDLWGAPQSQEAPVFTVVSGRSGGDRLEIAGTDIDAKFNLVQRRRGLLWYATYGVRFDAAYKVANETSSPVTARMTWTFPSADGVYDGFAVKADGRDVPVAYHGGTATAEFPISAGATAVVRTGYATKGLDQWRYVPVSGGASVIKDFHLAATTDFTQVDYPTDAVSPKESKRTADGMALAWDYDSVVSGRPIAIAMPKPLNPGPLASRIAYFAPVSLLFFFASLVLLTTTAGVRLHPMHYGFLAAAFFAFHLLFSYMVDRFDINVSFAVASLTSVALVVGYVWRVLGKNRALLEIAVSQAVFLVLFSYSFFFEGTTGLAVTIGSVLTLAYFMARTARTDWEAVFRKQPRAAAPPAPPVAPSPAAAAPESAFPGV